MTIKTIIARASVLAGLAAFSAYAQEQDVRYSLELHRLTPGIRANAMGNAFVATQPDGAHTYWNSACLPGLENKNLYFSHSGLFANQATYNAFLLAMPLPTGVGIGLNYVRYQQTGIPLQPVLTTSEAERKENLTLRPDPSSTTTGTMVALQDEILVCLAKQYLLELPRGVFYALPAPIALSVGSTFKFYRNQVDVFKTGGAKLSYYGLNPNMDLSAIARIGIQINPQTKFVERMFSIGVNIQDVLRTPVNWRHSNDYSETTQRNEKIGLSYLERTPWVHGHIQIAADFDRQYERIDHFGLEYSYEGLVGLMAGLDNRHPTVGAWVFYRYFRIDYAYSFHPLANTPLQVGLMISF